MSVEYQHLIDLSDYSVDWWSKIVTLGQDIYEYPKRYKQACSGKIMATLFYEPSTRTQMSFQSAMIRLGGSIIGFDNPATSSVAKGENLKDTTKIVSGYSDILIIRHTSEGAAKAAAISADCPVINAGDGGHLHPTQTLTDLLTLAQEKGRLDNLVIGVCGDLHNGRTVHSLCKALSCYKNNRFVLISTNELRLPNYIKDIITLNGCEYSEADGLDDCIDELDILYMTRIQRERFASEQSYYSQKNFILTKSKMENAKSDMIVMHPLPRVGEIAVAVDDDPRAVYFKQAEYGMYVRMALIMTILDNKAPIELIRGDVIKGRLCNNTRCITNKELYLPKSFVNDSGRLVCEFCDTRLVSE